MFNAVYQAITAGV